jgi:hypothetical protein
VTEMNHLCVKEQVSDIIANILEHHEHDSMWWSCGIVSSRNQAYISLVSSKAWKLFWSGMMRKTCVLCIRTLPWSVTVSFKAAFRQQNLWHSHSLSCSKFEITALCESLLPIKLRISCLSFAV